MLGTPETHRPQQTRQQKSKKLIQNDVTAVFFVDRIIDIHESRIYLLVNQHACGKSHHFHE